MVVGGAGGGQRAGPAGSTEWCWSGSPTCRSTTWARALPTLDDLVHRGAAGATNVRMLSGRPSTGEAYATLGAGTRVQDGPARLATTPAEAHAAGVPYEGAWRQS